MCSILTPYLHHTYTILTLYLHYTVYLHYSYTVLALSRYAGAPLEIEEESYYTAMDEPSDPYVATLYLHFCHTVVALMLHWCYTFPTLLLRFEFEEESYYTAMEEQSDL
jgi:hypothetical protein